MDNTILVLLSVCLGYTAGHWCGLGKIYEDIPKSGWVSVTTGRGGQYRRPLRDPTLVYDDILTYYDTEASRVGLQSYKPKDSPDSESFNFTSGLFTAPKEWVWYVTLTANLVMNRPDEDNIPHTGYAQLFIMINGELTALEHYLVVEQGKVASLSRKIALQQGDVLSVFVGYHVDSKYTYGQKYPDIIDGTYDSFRLDAVRLCIF